MTMRQRIFLSLAVLALVAVILLLVWSFREEPDTKGGVLVYKEAFMRIADQPWQGGRLCRSK